MTELFGTDKKNFIFIGEAGCGKSEIALNLAAALAEKGDRPVHLFDLDQTKPLMRARDACATVEKLGVLFHYEAQFYDAPTEVGGVREAMRDATNYTILDVGGNDTGARLIGGYAPFLNREDSAVFYVVNPYRPWSGSVEAIDGTLSAVLRASRVKKFSFVCNPNLGADTSEQEFFEGVEKTRAMLDPYFPVEFCFAAKALYEKVADKCSLPVFPLRLYLKDMYD